MNFTIESQLARHLAGVLTGIKISNLLLIENESVEEVIQLFEKSSISVITLHTSESKTTLLFYREDELIKYMNQEDVISDISVFGYYNSNRDEIFA